MSFKVSVNHGGGLYGMGQLMLYMQARQFGCDFSKLDLIGGTSTGVIVSAMIAMGLDLNLLYAIYQNRAKDIFPPSIRKYQLWLKTPQFPNSAIGDILKSIFGDARFSDVKIPLFATAFDLINLDFKVFESFDAADGALPLWEVVRCAVAAETYLDPHYLAGTWYGDGGVSANNPAVVGLVTALDKCNPALHDINMYSVDCGPAGGGGFVPHWIWGWAQLILRGTVNGTADKKEEKTIETFAKDMTGYQRCRFPKPSQDLEFWDCNVVPMIQREWRPMVFAGAQCFKDFIDS